MNKESVDIFDISYEGAGVGKIDNQIVFVPKTLEGEKVAVNIIKRKSSFMIGEISQIEKKSEKRIEPECPYFSVCGGCDFQHCGYGEEKKLKLRIVKRELEKAEYFGEIEFVECSKRFGYRNKIKLEVMDKKLCYFKPKTNNLFEVKRCLLASEKMNECLEIVEDFVQNNKLDGLKSVYIKEEKEQIAICFLFDKNAERVLKNIQKTAIFEGFLVFFAFGDVLESNSTKIYRVFGKGRLNRKVGDLNVDIDVSAFNQVNDEIAEKLYSYIAQKCDGKRVVNAYSGQGLLTYLIAEKAKFVYGIEYQVSAHESAEKLCENCKDYKVQNICGRVEDCLKSVLLRDNIGIIVLDPPKEGCGSAAVTEILESGISEIVYVSCNFSTLVRDLKVLNKNYEVLSVKIFDMFPCCMNVETVAFLRKKSQF